MNKLSIFKDVADVVVSIGVSSIVGNAIKMTTDPEAKLLKKIAIGIGGIVLSGMVGDLASKYTNQQIDNAVASVSSIVDNMKNAKAEKELVEDPKKDLDETTSKTTKED